MNFEFDQIVSLYHEALYRFAFTLARSEADACDLTQQTFYMWATRGHQLRDPAKAKGWLFTTLYRQFLNGRNRATRFPQVELMDDAHEMPDDSPELEVKLDAARAVELLKQMKEPYRATLTLFYLEDYSYKEIAATLGIPIGTVQSRLSRGMMLLQQLMAEAENDTGSSARSTSLPAGATAMTLTHRLAESVS